MGTHGLYGIRKGGVDKVTYNHWDSYPDGLGRSVLKFMRRSTKDQLNRLFDLIEMVDSHVPPTDSQKQTCVENGWFHPDVSSGSPSDWYCLLRELQGNFKELRRCIKSESKVLMLDDIDFIKSSQTCEYAYIINLDDEALEVWVGFQRSPQPGNRYGVQPNQWRYYPCRLVLRLSFNDVYKMELKTLVKLMNKASES